MPGAKRFDFAQRSKLLSEADRCGEKIKVEPDEFVKRLKLLDLEQKDPLPLHIMSVEFPVFFASVEDVDHFSAIRARWAWSQLKKDENGEISLSDLIRLELRYSTDAAKIGDIVKMIKECDSNDNKDLEESEIADLLVVRPHHSHFGKII
jgi:hypothetical protein